MDQDLRIKILQASDRILKSLGSGTGLPSQNVTETNSSVILSMLSDIKSKLNTGTLNTATVASSGGGHITNTDLRNDAIKQISIISNPCKTTLVSSPITNTGLIVFGFSTVDYSTGIPLYPGESLEFPVSNTNLIYAISEIDAEDINITYFN